MALTLDRLKELWEDPSKTKVAFNAQFEIIWLNKVLGWEIKGPLRDPMIAAFLLDENSEDRSLQSLASKHLGAPNWKSDFEPYEKSLAQLNHFPSQFGDVLTAYNQKDILWTTALDHFFQTQLATSSLSNLFSVEMENLKTLARMTTWGIQINQSLLSGWENEYRIRRRQIAEQLPFNPDSPQQVIRALQEAGVRVLSTGGDVLSTLPSGSAGGIPARVLEYRKVGKVLSTYLAGLREHIYPDGRIHPQFHQNRVVSGRLSGSNPNPQNFPRDTADLPYRRLFQGTWGRLLSVDFNQLELRIAAFLSRDPRLLHVYRTDQDIHDVTGERIWAKSAKQISENERVVSKVTNFTCLYDPFDTAPAALKLQCEADGIKLSWNDAASIVQSFRGAYERWFRGYIPAVIRKVLSEGQVRAKTGRIRRSPIPILAEFDQLFTPDGRSYWEVLRSIINSMDQGLAGDLVKVCCTIIDKRLVRRGFLSRVCNNVHDEILVDTYPPEEEEVVRIVVDTCTNPPTGGIFGWTIQDVVPLVVDIGIGENWSGAKAKDNKRRYP